LPQRRFGKEGHTMKKNNASRQSCCAAVLFLLCAVTPLTYASNLMPLIDITGGGQAVEPLADAVGGWEFHIDKPITIGAIGLWDEGKLPLQIAHEIGLWTSDQTLLQVAIVDNTISTPVPSAFAGGQWLFTSISPLQLQPGDYVLGAVWGDPILGADPFRINTNAVTSGVSYTAACAVFQLPSPELVFPDCGGGSLTDASFFGPNLAVVVPEPGSIALLGCGILTAAGALRRRLS
jgi:PEP-CTERM motif